LERFYEERDPELREQLALAYAPLAAFLARKFAGRGEPREDLIQVAQMGLLKAIDRYDPTRGTQFGTFATPTIVGEIKRYFRDKCWTIHVPRALRERNQRLLHGVDMLSQRLGRSPTIPELAEFAGMHIEEALAALEAGQAFVPSSLDAEGTGPEGEDSHTLGDSVGGLDQSLTGVEDRITIQWALVQLPEPAQTIVRLRFFEQRSQQDIARRLDLSPMHVSRTLRQALVSLRAFLAERST
jgi:RNA polymerase sigma-B factor